MYVGEDDEACSENRISLSQIFNRWIDHYITTEVGYNHLYALSDCLRDISNTMRDAADSIKQMTIPLDDDGETDYDRMD